MTSKIVLPGDQISDKPLYLETTYVQDGKTYTAVVGSLDQEGKYKSFQTTYRPKMGDTVVGVIFDITSWGYLLDINLAKNAGLRARDTRARLRIGDLVVGVIKNISPSGDIDLAQVNKLDKGKLFAVPQSKVPRIIGKKSSMLNTIREGTNTKITVGNNGYVWASEEGNILLVKKALDEIIANAHKNGLTDRMGKFLEENK